MHILLKFCKSYHLVILGKAYILYCLCSLSVGLKFFQNKVEKLKVFISYNKCTTLVGGVDNGEVCAYAGKVGVWENYIPLNFAGNLQLL